ncbi:putative DNA-binding domain-containing protein [Rhodanobacter umsongensis]|uniref:DNA-binding domain-containing protein n=1 Tax=Rhodanobacter umsongensis TaxID=633153 RepID=A0ABW0JLI1_9GAMM
MNRLRALQQRTLQAVLGDNPSRLRELRGDDRVDTSRRMDVYRQGYRLRLRDALAAEYPGLGLLAGKRFERLLDSYVAAHPSGHYNIRWHGAGLPAFLEYARPWCERPALAEMARLDWAISTAFDAADETATVAMDLSGVPAAAWADMHLRPQAHLQVLSFTANVDAFRRAADAGGPRPRLRSRGRPHHLLVWRQALAVHYRAIEDDERCTLAAAMRDESFALLCERLAEHHDPASALSRMAEMLRRWIDDGLMAGWRLQQESM